MKLLTSTVTLSTTARTNAKKSSTVFFCLYSYLSSLGKVYNYYNSTANYLRLTYDITYIHFALFRRI